MNPCFLQGTGDLEIEIRMDAEADEFWSYVGNKKNQRWTWYALERNTGVVLHGITEGGLMKAVRS